VPFIAMGIAAGLAAWFFLKRGAAQSKTASKAPDVPLKNPFSLTAGAKFAAFFAVVLLVVALVQMYWPGRGLYMVAALAGLTDVDAITLSMAEYAKTGDSGVAVNAIVIAALMNTLVKCGMAATLGGAALRRPIMIAGAAIVASGLAVVGASAALS
jgi:uncharacterized membrane protein (DUF4010 family)